jgi:hypothetical protein
VSLKRRDNGRATARRIVALRNLSRQLDRANKVESRDQAWRDRVLYEMSVLQSALS